MCNIIQESKELLNIYHYLGDFGVEAEWRFWATFHGKNSFDEVGTIKRLAHIKMMK